MKFKGMKMLGHVAIWVRWKIVESFDDETTKKEAIWVTYPKMRG
jgi:hypothetical protein